MNIYELSRNYWDFCFENPEKVKPYHTAIYFFAIEHCNRLGWKKVFGFPTVMVLEATGIKSYNSYKKYFDHLVDWGFIEVLEYSKNQYSSNIIALSFKDEASDKALDKALSKHSTKHLSKQVQSTSESNDSIDIQLYNYTNTQLYNDDDKEISPPTDVLFPVEDLAEEYLKNQKVINAVSSVQKIKIENIKNKIPEFVNHLKTLNQFSKTPQDFASHFLNWLKKNKNNQQSPNGKYFVEVG